jgi:hypothetical protein
MKNIIIEIDGERHKLIEDNETEFSCEEECSLNKICFNSSESSDLCRILGKLCNFELCHFEKEKK